MAKASVNGQDTLSSYWDRVAKAIETSSLILGQLVTLGVHQTTYQRETQRRGRECVPTKRIFIRGSVAASDTVPAKVRQGVVGATRGVGQGTRTCAHTPAILGIFCWQTTC